MRGHKGVGLTFLAYGFDFFEFESKTPGGSTSGFGLKAAGVGLTMRPATSLDPSR